MHCWDVVGCRLFAVKRKWYGGELIQNEVVVSYSQTLKTVMIVCGLLATAWLSHAAIAQDRNALKAGVVKITTKTGQIGTGFIVRLEPDVVYIITAAHVIAGDNQPEVEFFTQRQNPLQGTVLPGAQINDDIRGLALIMVKGDDDLPAGIEALPFSTMAKIASVGKKLILLAILVDLLVIGLW